MKLYKYFFPALLSGVLVCSCTAGFEEINRNPNGPTEVPPGLLIPAIAESTMDLMYSTFNGGDMGSCWAQHWAKVDYNDEERYQPRATQFGVIWNGLYAGSPAPSGGGILDANIMYDLAKAEGNKNLQGVALIMRVYMFSVLTDVFGDIPFTDAIKAKSGIIHLSMISRRKFIRPYSVCWMKQTVFSLQMAEQSTRILISSITVIRSCGRNLRTH